jgi:molybdopterin molybdotransferase
MTAGLVVPAVTPSGTLLDPEAARAAILGPIVALDAIDVPIAAAIGGVLAAPAHAVVDLPPFDRSSMDGFAVRAGETLRPLRIIGEVAAGDVAPDAVTSGTAMAISTGAPMPPGADAVLQSELGQVVGDDVLLPEQPVAPGRFVRFRGEDLRAGDVLAQAGAVLTVQRAMALASAGVGRVHVHRGPTVHLLTTGDELQAPGTAPRPGAVFESSAVALGHLAERAGATVTYGGIVGDDAQAVRQAVQAGLDADVLLVSGGMSVGPHDHVKPAFAACGVQEVFWRVAVKPGKPVWFGRHGRTLVFGLPGNPLSGLVGFLLFVEPALARLQGDLTAAPGRRRGRLAAPAAAAEDGRMTLLTARFERDPGGELVATPTARQGSHMTGALGESDGFVIVPPDAGALEAGDAVDLLVLDEAGGRLR